jgi:hypothetical protein
LSAKAVVKMVEKLQLALFDLPELLHLSLSDAALPFLDVSDLIQSYC